VIAGIAVAVVFAPGSALAWREHLVAITVGAACAGIQLLAYRWSARRAVELDAGDLVPEQTVRR
jgi:hypothetical protein